MIFFSSFWLQVLDLVAEALANVTTLKVCRWFLIRVGWANS